MFVYTSKVTRPGCHKHAAFTKSMKKLLSHRQYGHLIFGILAVAYILVYFHRLCAAVVAVDMMQDLKAGGAMMGLLAAAYFYPYAAMQVPAGLLSDSWGPRRTITLFFIIACGGSILLGLAPTVWWAILGRTLVGLGIAMLFVPTMKILSVWFRPREFSSMTGILIAMGGVGTLVATTPLAILSSTVGWRMSFVIIGLITIAIAALVWFVVRDRPSNAGFPEERHTAQDPGERVRLRDGVRQVVSHTRFWAMAAWFFFNTAIFFAFGGLWGGPFLMQIYGLTKTESGNILAMLAVGMIIGSPALSFISDRLLRRRKPVIIISSVLTTAITAIFAFHAMGLPIPVLYLLFLCMGVFTSAIVAIGFTATKELFPLGIAGTSTGLVNFFPFMGGAVAQPLLGYLLGRHGKIAGSFTLAGYEDALLALFLSSIMALAASFMIKETLPGKHDHPAS
jgi:sugar phosphate permease